MKKKFKIYISLFCIILFFPIKSLASSSVRCDLALGSLSANKTQLEILPQDAFIEDYGFSLLEKYDQEEKKWNFVRDENRNFIVGKINSLNLAKKLRTGTSIISVNGKKPTEENELFILFTGGAQGWWLYDEKQEEMIKSIKKVKVEFFDPEDEKKGNFILDLDFQTTYIADVELELEDISITNIDIKNGQFEASLKYDFAYRLTKRSNKKFYELLSDLIIYKIDENDNDSKWTWDICNFSEKEIEKSLTGRMNPGEDIVILNNIKENKNLIKTHYQLTPYSDKISEDQRNEIYLEKKIQGTYKIKNKFNLRAFPFDKQLLSINFMDDGWNLDQRQILVTENNFESMNSFLDENDITGWNIMDYKIHPFQYHDEFMMEKDYSDGLSINIIIERKHGYYVFKIILPIILILMVCWSSVWIDPKEIESRLTITIVCLLSLIAYNFVIDSEMPKLEYLTVMDWIILISYFYATIPNFLSIASFRLQKTNLVACERIETYGKRYGILSYIIIIFLIVAINANLNPQNSSALISWMIGN